MMAWIKWVFSWIKWVFDWDMTPIVVGLILIVVAALSRDTESARFYVIVFFLYLILVNVQNMRDRLTKIENRL